jgi:hypothetical protein
MKVMAIIGIVFFSICMLGVIASAEEEVYDEALAWGFLGLLYALPFAIVVLVQVNKKDNPKIEVTQELLKLNDLKDKGILSEEEFQSMKMNLLRK